MSAGARELTAALGDPELEALLALVDALEIANGQFNLTAIRDRDGMLHKHLLDSLSLQPFLRGSRIADVGTGAGFPGLPLAITNPDRHFALIEATGKKARFVESTARDLGLTNVEVVQARAEGYRPAAPFDTVIARALSSLADFVAYAGHLCAPDVHCLRVPGLDAERHLVEISRAARGTSKS